MQAMGSITPITIKSIRNTVAITGNKMAKYKLEVVGLLGALEAVSTAVVVVPITWVVIVGWSVVDWWVDAVTALLTIIMGEE